MLHRIITVKHTVSYMDAPLLSLGNLPGPDPDLTPAQARQLAAVLLKAADDCEALRDHTRRYGPERREYPLSGANLTA